MRILLVEDEKDLSDALVNILEKEKYHVDVAYDGRLGLDYALKDSYNLIILDRNLPYLNGMEILRKVREKGLSTPILILSALGLDHNKVEGLDAGADDYLSKPFSTSELLARVRALTRRNVSIIKNNVISFNDLHLNIVSYELYKDEEKLKLSKKELELMKYLIANPNIVVSKENILDKIWGFDSELMSNSIEVYISFLRKKVEYLGANAKLLTIRGVGYKLVDKDV